MAYGKITLEDVDANTIDIPLPEFGYTVEIDYPWDIQKLEGPGYASYDNGEGAETYDKRKCNCLIILTPTEMGVLNDFLREGNVTISKGRAYGIEITMEPNSGFFPFGPDKGDGGPGGFDVGIIVKKHGRTNDRPFRHFIVELDIQQTGQYPLYNFPSNPDEGSFVFGSISNCRFPPGWFQPKVKYGYSRTTTQGSDIEWMDRGESADGYEVGFEFFATPEKAARVINYINSIRTSTFSVTPNGKSYMFGEDKGAGPFVVKNISNKIKLTHVRKSLFRWPMKLSYVSG